MARVPENPGRNPEPGDNLPTVRVTLSGALVRLFPAAEPECMVRAASVADLLEALERRWPGMRDRIADSRPEIRRHINVFVNGDRARLATPLTDGARVYILTAMSGG